MKGFFSAAEIRPAKTLLTLAPKCGKCGLYKTCQSPKMPVTGEGRKKLLIIAEAPGAREDQRGIQLCGESGRLLEKTLRKFGVEMRRDCWLTNALSCRPPKNATPTSEQIAHCRPLVVRAIQELNPEKIILLGGPAVKSVYDWRWK